MSTSPDRPAEGGFEASDASLRKSMKFTHLLFMSLAAIIGSGWLYGSLDASSVAGPAAIFSWVVGAILVLFIALTYAEISGMLPRSGAIARYPNLTHGQFFGWFMGWAYFLASVTVPAIEAEAVVGYINGHAGITGWMHTVNGVTVMTWEGAGVAIGLMVVFFIVNYFGVRLLAEVNRWVTVWKLIIPTMTAIAFFFLAKGANYTSLGGGFTPTGPSKIFFALATSGVFFAYLGFRQALDFAGEARNPQKDVPRATIASVLIAMVIYVALQIGFIGVINWHAAGLKIGDWTGLTGSSWAGSPFADAASAAGVAWLGTLLLIDSVVSPTGTGWVYMGATTRNVYGTSVHGFIPRVFQKMNSFGIPWVSAILAGIVGILFMYPAPSWYDMVSLITGMTALTYIMGGVMLPILRKHAPDMHRPFRLPMAQFWAPVSFLAAMLVVYWSGYGSSTSGVVQLYAFAFLGLPVIIWYYAPRNNWFQTSAKKQLAAAAGVVFLAAWIYLMWAGGYVLRVTPPAANSLGFITYWIAQMAAVAFLVGAVWYLAGPKGRQAVRSSLWIFVMLYALMPVDYYGPYGPYKVPPIGFGPDLAIVIPIGLICYYWALAVGYNTDELADITAKAKEPAAAAPSVGS
jgi:amino acid transporter